MYLVDGSPLVNQNMVSHNYKFGTTEAGIGRVSLPAR